ncbi:MAG: serine hydrolase [Pirellulales bacterium]|nr:serine hydrolase [Pirellulales bacterium]
MHRNLHSLVTITFLFPFISQALYAQQMVFPAVIDDGLVTLDTLVSEYVPSMAAEYPEVTPRHCVTHTSGYVAQDEIYPPSSSRPEGPEDPFTPGSPLFNPPGSQYAYANTPLTQMMNVLTRVIGEPIQDFFQRRIGDTIGLEAGSWDWGHYETSDRLLVDGGGGDLHRGVIICAEDLARLGHLHLNQGIWDGHEVLSPEWIAEATRVQVPVSVPRHPLSPVDGPGEYGYGWWIGSNWYAASGYENNFMLVYPDWNLIVTILGHNNANLPGWGGFINQVKAAIMGTSVWDENGDGRWGDIDPISNNSRWLTEDGHTLLVYPERQLGNAIVKSDTVSVDMDHTVNSLTIDSGTLSIADIGNLSGDIVRINVNGSLMVSGKLRATTAYDFGILSIAETGVLEAASTCVNSGGLLTGSGKIIGSLSNYGSVPPGTSTAILDISSNYTQYAAGMIEIEIAGTQPGSEHDALVIEGSAKLDGHLEIVLDPLYTPLLGDEIEILTALGGVSKTFATVDGVETMPDLSLAVLYEPNRLVIRGTLPGDSNTDNDVNEDDFQIWHGNYGVVSGKTWQTGDNDGDGDVDGNDFLVWQRSFGHHTTHESLAVTVPEPSSTLLIALGISGWFGYLITKTAINGR